MENLVVYDSSNAYGSFIKKKLNKEYSVKCYNSLEKIEAELKKSVNTIITIILSNNDLKAIAFFKQKSEKLIIVTNASLTTLNFKQKNVYGVNLNATKNEIINKINSFL